MPKKKLKNTSKPNFKHRGRIQAQGENLEDSESWAKNIPPTKTEGIQMTENLKNKIPKHEAKIREKQFIEVKEFITRASENGGLTVIINPIKLPFPVKGTKEERVDIEIHKGTAFIKDIKNGK